ncbi:MAG: signal peptidase I [Clostridia bacterium]|nr:signal peptidase I [Clostridia bacterium]
MNNKKNNSNEVKAVFFEWIEALVTSIVIVVLLFTLFLRVVNISGSSMENTLHNNDKVILTNFMYENPSAGDIVVVSKAQNLNEPIIKRVIAVEGQTVDINFTTGNVSIDNKVIKEPYIKNATVNNEGMQFPVTVPEGHIFVLGDNRMNSKDSRSPQIGMIDTRNVVGKALFVIFPFDRIGGLS